MKNVKTIFPNKLNYKIIFFFVFVLFFINHFMTNKNNLTNHTQSAIIWPNGYVPAFCDNYVSNQIIIKGVRAIDVWKYLEDTQYWPKYYSNASKINLHNKSGSVLEFGTKFQFTTFGFLVESEVKEFEKPQNGKAGRIAWYGKWNEKGEEQKLEVHHAWIIEDLPNGTVRILTEETQNGKPAQEMAKTKPNPMLNAHQEWLDGLAKAALEKIK